MLHSAPDYWYSIGQDSLVKMTFYWYWHLDHLLCLLSQHALLPAVLFIHKYNKAELHYRLLYCRNMPEQTKTMKVRNTLNKNN